MKFNNRCTLKQRTPNSDGSPPSISTQENVPCFVSSLGLEKQVRLFGNTDTETFFVYFRLSDVQIDFDTVFLEDSEYRVNKKRKRGNRLVVYVNG